MDVFCQEYNEARGRKWMAKAIVHTQNLKQVFEVKGFCPLSVKQMVKALRQVAARISIAFGHHPDD